jgi:hypothetical protein
LQRVAYNVAQVYVEAVLTGDYPKQSDWCPEGRRSCFPDPDLDATVAV